MLRYVDEAALSPLWKWLARIGAPIAAILIPAAFFLSVASPNATQPNGLINLVYIGALFSRRRRAKPWSRSLINLLGPQVAQAGAHFNLIDGDADDGAGARALGRRIACRGRILGITNLCHVRSFHSAAGGTAAND